eukprot:snap_masked-scaffold_18-processed-gene-4.26-mRNA-1 protein AED:1.00 eAED:1.00 QI:0/0/0/0/1/1/2/0/490
MQKENLIGRLSDSITNLEDKKKDISREDYINAVINIISCENDPELQKLVHEGVEEKQIFSEALRTVFSAETEIFNSETQKELAKIILQKFRLLVETTRPEKVLLRRTFFQILLKELLLPLENQQESGVASFEIGGSLNDPIFFTNLLLFPQSRIIFTSTYPNFDAKQKAQIKFPKSYMENVFVSKYINAEARFFLEYYAFLEHKLNLNVFEEDLNSVRILRPLSKSSNKDKNYLYQYSVLLSSFSCEMLDYSLQFYVNYIVDASKKNDKLTPWARLYADEENQSKEHTKYRNLNIGTINAGFLLSYKRESSKISNLFKFLNELGTYKDFRKVNQPLLVKYLENNISSLTISPSFLNRTNFLFYLICFSLLFQEIPHTAFIGCPFIELGPLKLADLKNKEVEELKQIQIVKKILSPGLTLLYLKSSFHIMKEVLARNKVDVDLESVLLLCSLSGNKEVFDRVCDLFEREIRIHRVDKEKIWTEVKKLFTEL